MPTPWRVFPSSARLAPFELSRWPKLRVRLDRRERPAVGSVERVMVMDTSTGARGDLGAYLGQRLEGEVIRRMAERRACAKDE